MLNLVVVATTLSIYNSTNLRVGHRIISGYRLTLLPRLEPANNLSRLSVRQLRVGDLLTPPPSAMLHLVCEVWHSSSGSSVSVIATPKHDEHQAKDEHRNQQAHVDQGCGNQAATGLRFRSRTAAVNRR